MRILIAEDDQDSRLVLLRSLEKLGYDCVQTENGDQAWELFSELKPDVVIADRTMPGVDGAELCRRVRSHDRERYTYFIMLSPRTDAEQRASGVEAGADDWLAKPLDQTEVRSRLALAARFSGLRRQLHDQRGEIERLSKEILDDERGDPLARMANRLRMEEDLEALAGRALRYGHGFAVALFDIDDFKKYNDTCGHAAGDDTLRSVGRTLSMHSRSGDMTYRYGGEEFLVVLPEQGLDGAIIAVERRRRAVEVLAIPHPGRGVDGIVTVSAGVAALEQAKGDREALEDLLRRVEDALAHAKSHGKNRLSTDKEARARRTAEAGAST
jgi:two-component system chemotaxis response regulator CheY